MDNGLKIIYGILVVMMIAIIIFIPLILGTEGDFIGNWSASPISGTALRGVATDNNYIWLADYVGDEIYKYFMNGTYTGSSFDTSGQSGDPYGIETDGTYIWVADPIDKEVYRYFINGTYVDSFDTSAKTGYITAPIIIDASQIWVLDYQNDDVTKYWMNGTWIGEWTPSEGIADITSMTSTDDFIWLMDHGDNVYKYWVNETYILIWNYSSSGQDFVVGSATNGTDLWMADHEAAYVYRYEVTPVAPVDTCTCAGAGNDWEIDMSDYCNITDACDLTTGTLSFTGAGYCNCNASVDTTNLGDPGASGVLYIQDSCLITID